MFQFELADIGKFISPIRNGPAAHLVGTLDIAFDSPDSPLVPRIPTLPEIKAVINKWQTYMFANGGWNSLYLENHDQARSVSRLLGFGSDPTGKNFDFGTYEEDLKKYWSVGSKLLAILHATQGGTVFIYQGEEIGSVNVPRSWPIEEYKDIATINFYRE
jgi:oligo-1,6-glucosidase